MAQLEQTPLSKFVADAFAWFFLLAAVSSLVAFFILVFPVFANPESSAIYQQVSAYVAADEPMVAIGSDVNGGFKIGFGMAPKIGECMADLVLEDRDTIPEAFKPEASV